MTPAHTRARRTSGSGAGSDRRDFLRTLLGGAAGLSLSCTAFGQTGASRITGTKLTDNITLFSGAGSNALVLSGPDGLVMVDGGLSEYSADLLKLVQPLGGPVRTLFNTHWHAEHTGSNEALGKAGAKIIAHENTRLWLGAEVILKWQNKVYKPLPKVAIPTESFYTTGKMSFGNEQIVYGHLGQAHTDGDMYVFFPRPNILVTGDVFTVGSYPILDWVTGGWIGGMADAARTLLGLTDTQTRVIPGDGPVQTRADLQALSDMVGTMRTRFIEMLRKGMSARDMLAAAPTKEFDARWGNPELFISNAYPGLWGHVREVGGIV